MQCECGGASQVLETRRHADQIRRRRRCLRCRRIWMTIEVGTTDVRRLWLNILHKIIPRPEESDEL